MADWSGVKFPKGSKGLVQSVMTSFGAPLALILNGHVDLFGTAVAQWLRCCATNRKVAGSIPAGFSGFFVDTKSFRSHYGPGVDSASKRNEYQEYFLGIKAAGK